MATAQWALRRMARPAAVALAGTATRRARSQAATMLPLGTPAPVRTGHWDRDAWHESAKDGRV